MDIDWTQALTIIGANLVMIVTSIGITITLYLHSDKKIDAIHEEIKDFHGRLCQIEASRHAKDTSCTQEII